MTRAEKLYRWLGWFLTLCGGAAIAYVFCGCSKQPPPLSPAELAIVAMAAECEKVIHREIAVHDDCPGAQLAINSERVCAAAFPKGVNLDCPEYRK